MVKKIFIENSVSKLQQYLGEYNFLTNCVSSKMSFENAFELNKKLKILDNKVFLLLKRIDPVYESLINNNFTGIDLNISETKITTAIMHRISILDSIVNEMNHIVVNYQLPD